jgi:hypothetical protein
MNYPSVSLPKNSRFEGWQGSVKLFKLNVKDASV